LTIASTHFALGRHIAEVPQDDLEIGLKLMYIGEFFAIIAVTISKTSFAVTLLRLATQAWHTYLLWFVIVTLNVVMWLCGLFEFIQCSPVEKLWDLDVPGTCWDSHIAVNYAIFSGCTSCHLIVFV
jgi:hypothetical protein